MTTRVDYVESANEIQSLVNDIAPLVAEVFFIVLICSCVCATCHSIQKLKGSRSPREIVFRRASDTFLSFVFSDLLSHSLSDVYVCSALQGQLSFYTLHYLFMRFQKVHCSRSEHRSAKRPRARSRLELSLTQRSTDT